MQCVHGIDDKIKEKLPAVLSRYCSKIKDIERGFLILKTVIQSCQRKAELTKKRHNTFLVLEPWFSHSSVMAWRCYISDKLFRRENSLSIELEGRTVK